MRPSLIHLRFLVITAFLSVHRTVATSSRYGFASLTTDYGQFSFGGAFAFLGERI